MPRNLNNPKSRVEGNKCWMNYYYRNKKTLVKKATERATRNLRKWQKLLIPYKTHCQICGKTIYANGKTRGETICLDHTKIECGIKVVPNSWLRARSITEDNIKIFKDCNFGYLCLRCNANLPEPSKRKEWLKIVINYINNKEEENEPTSENKTSTQ